MSRTSALAVLGALLPRVVMSFYALNHGGNNFSDDYWSYIEILTLHLQGKTSLPFLLTPVLTGRT
jgi:hypothetical protein